MKQIPRRKPSELAFVLKQSGTTHLLLVEGFSDRAVYRWALSAERAKSLAIHAVSELDVPSDWVIGELNFGSNRDLVAAVCMAFDSCEAFVGLSVRGVVDLDCGIPEPWRLSASLLVTDFPALESYCFNPATLEKWLTIALRETEGASGVCVVDELAPILSGLYHVRARVGTLGGGASRVLTYKNATWKPAFADSNSTAHFEYGVGSAVPDDARTICYGHDLAEVLLIRFANSVKNGAGLRTADAVERSLLSCLEASVLLSESLFEHLAAWVATA